MSAWLRLARGLAALVALVALLIGVPWFLLVIGGDLLPSSASAGRLWQTLTRPDDGRVLVGLVLLVAWGAWLVFALAVLGELVSMITRRRLVLRLPGLGGPQRLAAGLLLAVLALAVTPQVGVAQPNPTPTASPVTEAPPTPADAGAAPAAAMPVTVTQSAAATRRADDADDTGLDRSRTVVHTVEPGDDLWSLAERYYGAGREWRTIASANPERLTGGPDRLDVGWRLRIPGVESPEPVVVTERPDAVTVREGDTLSGVAEEAYGDAARWTDLWQANRDRLDDPDELRIGMRLRVPHDTVADDGSVPESRTEDRRDRVGPPARDESTKSEDTAPPDAGGPSQAEAGPTDRQVPTTTARGEHSGDAADDRGESASRGADGGPARQDTRPGTGSAPGSPAPGSAPRATAAPTEPAPRVDSTPSDEAVPPQAAETAQTVLGVALASVGALLAAGLVAGLVARRRVQQQVRPLGRRVLHPGPVAVETETRLAKTMRPAGLRTLDLASRAVAAHCHRTGTDLPVLRHAVLADDTVVFVWDTAAGDPPVGFEGDDAAWSLRTGDATTARLAPGLDVAPRAWPALVTLGRTDDETVLVDLETLGALAVEGADSADRGAVLTAIGTELAFAPWADEMVLTLVGGPQALATALAQHNVSHTDDVDALLDRLAARAREQRAQLVDGSAAQRRLDPDLTDPWVPEVLLVAAPLSSAQRRRLLDLVLAHPRVTLAAVLAGDVASEGTAGSTDPRDSGTDDPSVPVLRLEQGRPTPTARWDGVTLQPQLLAEPAAAAVRELVAVTGSEETTPAPWWPVPGEAAPDNVTYLGARFGGWSDPEPDRDPVHAAVGDWDRSDDLDEDEPAVRDDRLVPGDEGDDHGDGHGDPASGRATRHDTPSGTRPGWTRADHDHDEHDQQDQGEERAVLDHEAAMADPVHPILRLLGPVDLIGATGTEPPRAARQCLEYCGWLLQHPGSTAPAMTAGLVVAEGTRRSNMSRLRTWLGADDAGEPYLPDAYTGRISLHPAVSSDWQRLQILTARGVPRAGDAALRAALDLVRGAPLADAAPGQWHWAEELRTDMISAVRDIGVELATRAIEAHDIDLARWAAARALVAAPGDELLMVARIRTEQQAGHRPEVERLTLQLAAQARQLGVDLAPETVEVLQEVLEGRVRARLA